MVPSMHSLHRCAVFRVKFQHPKHQLLQFVSVFLVLFLFLGRSSAKCPDKCQCRNSTGTYPFQLRVKCGLGVAFTSPLSAPVTTSSGQTVAAVSRANVEDNMETISTISSDHRLSNWQFLDFDETEAAAVITL